MDTSNITLLLLVGLAYIALTRADYHEPITTIEARYNEEHPQNRGLRAGSKPSRPISGGARNLQIQPQCAYDNGFYDNTAGYLNEVSPGYFGRFTLLDDFVVLPGEVLQVDGFRWYHVWASGTTSPAAISPFLEIVFRSDAGGTPGAPITGTIPIANYQEIPNGDIHLGSYFIEESLATFSAPQTFTEGTYWIEATIVGPKANHWLIKQTTTGSPLWYNNAYFGGLNPGINLFGRDADLNFCLDGSLTIDAPIDIKFCSDPNGFNCKAKGVVPMTVFGTDSLSVEDIDLDTVQLCLAEDESTCLDDDSLVDFELIDRGDPDTDLGASQCDSGDILNSDSKPDLELAWKAEDVVGTLLGGCSAYCNGGAGPTLIFKAETDGGDNVISTPVDDAGIDQLFIQRGAPQDCL